MNSITVSFKRFQAAALLSVAALALLAVSPASASSVTTYNDVPTFLGDIQSNFYLNNFNNLGGVGTPTSPDFSHGPFEYTASVPGDKIFMSTGHNGNPT